MIVSTLQCLHSAHCPSPMISLTELSVRHDFLLFISRQYVSNLGYAVDIPLILYPFPIHFLGHLPNYPTPVFRLLLGIFLHILITCTWLCLFMISFPRHS
jgi:hypothetical protein